VTQPDLWVTPTTPAGPSIGFGLADVAQLGQYSSGGYAWTAIQRPRRKAFLEYTSDQLGQLTLPLILDGADDDASIEHSVSLVTALMHPTASTGQPPIVSVAGPVEQAGVTGWVTQAIAWGNNQIRRRDGALTQIDVVLTLIEYSAAPTGVASPTLAAQLSAAVGVLAQTGIAVPAQLASLIEQLPSLLSAAPASTAADLTTQIAEFVASIPNNPAGAAQVVNQALPQLAQLLPTLGGGRAYFVRDGDTLARIAARELGDYRKANVIAVLNGIRDPQSVGSGQRILLP
jgi:hypothetical protein